MDTVVTHRRRQTGFQLDEWERALMAARGSGVPIQAPSRAGFNLDVRTAEKLCVALVGHDAETHGYWGWKIGASNDASQKALGATAPFVTPVSNATVSAGDRRVQLESFNQPVLEVELIVESTADTVLSIRAALEIADTRYHSWTISIEDAIADFGLHGHLIEGTEIAQDGEVEWQLTHNAQVVQMGVLDLDLTIANWRFARSHTLSDLQSSRSDGTFAVATGSIADPLPLSPGQWRMSAGSGEASIDVA